MADEEWTFESWWCVVIGDERDAAGAVREFCPDRSERGIDEWLGIAEADSWVTGAGHNLPLPEAWKAHHARALGELLAAARSLEA
jgi:hypothetical protein